MGKPEDVIDEKQHVLAFFVSEIFGDSKSGKTDSCSGAGGFVHLSVNQSGLTIVAVDVNDLGSLHFVVKIVSFSGSFSDACEH